jgi:hypothetical protein
MKKIVISSIISAIILLTISCKRNIADAKPAETPITIGSFNQYKQDAEGNLFVTLNEYFDQPVTLTNATLSAFFKKGNKPVNVGGIMVNNKYELQQSTNNNYLLNTGVDAKDFLDRSVNFDVATTDTNFPSVKIPTSVPSNFMVKTSTNIGLEGLLNKKQDLTLKWVGKSVSGNLTQRSSDVAYLAIVAGGVPPITKEIPDNGELTINAAELSSLPINSQAVIRLGRVTQNCTTQNGKTVCINVINNSSSGPLTVQ